MPQKPMAWSILATGPYAERLWEPRNGPVKDAEGTYVFTIPLGPTGAMPLVALDEVGKYAKWMFEHRERSAGLDLGVAIAHVSGQDLADAFEKVTGKKSRYNDIPLKTVIDNMPKGKIGTQGSPGYDDPTLKTVAEHFGPWFQIFRESGGNTGLWSRDYEMLDDIMPDRIRTLEQWMRAVNYDGSINPVLKTGLSLEVDAGTVSSL
jgi:hypothetical protein